MFDLLVFKVLKSLGFYFRQKIGQSLFDQQPPFDPAKAKQPHYCKCGGNGNVDCTKGKGANNPAKGVSQLKWSDIMAIPSKTQLRFNV